MIPKPAMRVVSALAAGAALIAAPPGRAQTWQLEGGVAARSEYNDNYFFSPDNRQSAFTGAITPFVTAARRTEASDITALLAVGANKVWGVSPSTSYLSGRFDFDASSREQRSTWGLNASFVRSPSLQNETGVMGAVLGLAYTNAASVTGRYEYALTERWSLGALATGYDNRYDGVANSDNSFSDNHGYTVAGRAAYAYSINTNFTGSASYAYYESGISRSDSVTVIVGIVHRFSPQLTVSASGGGFWSDSVAVQDVLTCATTPSLCDSALVQLVSATGTRRRETGGLFGGNVTYAISENVDVGATVTESLTPSSTGVLSKTDTVAAALSRRFGDRISGRLGANYTRTTYPATSTGSLDYNYSQGEAGLSYALAERWTIDVGYRYTRARYSENGFAPRSNAMFLTIAYNWPGASLTGWVGRPPEAQVLPGAGLVSLPDRSRVAPTPGPSESGPFDPLTLP